MNRLIDKSRTLNRLLQKAAGTAVDFMEMAEVLRELVQSDSYVFSRKGKLLGYGIAGAAAQERVMLSDKKISPGHNSLLFSISETAVSGQNAETKAIHEQIRLLFTGEHLMMVPIIGGEQRVGTLLLSRDGQAYSDDDVILAEYGATIIGMEILRGHVDESEIEARSKAAVQVAVGSLSFSELEAVEHILEELKEREGLLVASKIADRAGITRSVIVNALRKLESAGVIETRSLGMKGTYIKILNDRLVDEILKTELKAKV